jgi:hypothetical protein
VSGVSLSWCDPSLNHLQISILQGNLPSLNMSKLINLFIDSDKLDGPKNYKSWKCHMQNTLIYNELWHDICDGDTPPTKPIDVAPLAKWELKDEKLFLCFDLL